MKTGPAFVPCRAAILDRLPLRLVADTGHAMADHRGTGVLTFVPQRRRRWLRVKRSIASYQP
jgi:hypothetical protein